MNEEMKKAKLKRAFKINNAPQNVIKRSNAYNDRSERKYK